jgi:zinc and cadmium transporter
MPVFISIIFATFSISLISFIGRLSLFLREEILNKIIIFLVSLSAGALIGGAFFHLIPEAIEAADKAEKSLFHIFLYLVAGFCTFFILEHFIKWHHHHSLSHPEIKPFTYLILISSAVHHFIDGLIIASAFMAGAPIGISTAFVVASHEIPQEIGNYGILVYGGINRVKALFLNFFSAASIILGGALGFLFFGKAESQILFFLPFAAGSFIYVAASDLIPQIKEEVDSKKSAAHFFIFLTGIAIMILIRLYL